MRIKFRYGAAVGILAAAFSTLGLASAQAGQNPGTSVPTPAGAVSVQAPAAHLPGITGKSVVLNSTFERSAWQHDTGIAQREDNSSANGQEQFGLPGQQDRVLMQSDRCNHGYDRCGCNGYNYGHCCGYGHSHSGCCGYNNGYDHGGCCGYGNGYNYGHGDCCGYGYNYGHCCGYGYSHGGCCGYNNGYNYGHCCGYGYNNGRCVSHYGA